jgi:hypothetical protein
MATNQEVHESLGTNPQGFSNELFLDVCESFRYGVMSYASEQAIPREVQIPREIMSIKDNTQKYQRYLELTSRPATADIAFTIPRCRW